MTRVVLIHWKPEEAAAKMQLLAASGFEPHLAVPQNVTALRSIAAGAEAVLIDLSRLPLQGRAIAIELRRRAESRHVPIVFAGGARDKVDAIREVLPDAGYIEWDGIPGTLMEAIRAAPKSPRVPDTMAGYSGTPLPKKLGIRAGTKVALLGAPAGFEATLGPVPEGSRLVRKVAGAERILLFVSSMKELVRRWDAVTRAAAEGATVWIVWPKKASGTRTDVSENTVRAYGLARGWVDYKICAVDYTWSGLAFARRKPGKAAHL
jgi:hypothetical protein